MPSVSTSVEPVRIGVVGLGRFGRLHSLTAARLAETRLVGVVARRSESLDAFRAELPDVPGWTDLDRAIDESGAEAWIVASSTASHVDVTERLLRAGKAVLLEKPVAATLAEAERLAPWVRDDSRNLMVGHILLFNSEFRELRAEAARRGGVGFIDCARHRPASIVRDFAGENPLHATMVHDLYCLQVLLNREEPVGFSAQYHRTPDGAIDVALAQLRWASGPLATCVASYTTPFGMPPRGFDRMEVFGTGWAARIEPNPRPMEIWDDRARWPMALEISTGAGHTRPTGMMAEEQRTFCGIVRGREDVPVGATYRDAMQVQRWLDRLDAAARE
jgi:myo-inositol 2-dehydrogenase/D-chiro-inositol 1-dehydrogenase